MSLEEINDAILQMQALMDSQQDEFQEEHKKLQERYDELATNHELKATKMRQHIKSIRSILKDK